MQEDGINSFCVVPLTTGAAAGCHGLCEPAQTRVWRRRPGVSPRGGKQVAVAVDNVLHHQDLVHDRRSLASLWKLRIHRVPSGSWELLQDLAQRLPSIVPFDYINVVLHEPTRNVMRLWLWWPRSPVPSAPAWKCYGGTPADGFGRISSRSPSTICRRNTASQVDVHPA